MVHPNRHGAKTVTNLLNLSDVTMVSINDLPAKPTPAERATFRAALVSTAQTLTLQLRAVGAAQTEAKSAKESRSGLLVRTFLTAIMSGDLLAVETALGKGASKKDAPGPWSEWQAAKAMSSQATFLNQFLARNVVQVPEGKDTFVVGGYAVDGPITASHKAALTSPAPADTGIGTIIKYARAQGKAVGDADKAKAASEDAAIDAFMAEHRADMLKLGADASTVRDLVKLDTWSGPTLDTILSEGAALVETQAEEERASLAAADETATIERVVRMVSTMSAHDLDALIVAIENRKAEDASMSVATDTQASGSASKGRKRA